MLFESTKRTLTDAVKTAGNVISNAASSVSGAAISKVSKTINTVADQIEAKFKNKEEASVASATSPNAAMGFGGLLVFGIIAFILLRKVRV